MVPLPKRIRAVPDVHSLYRRQPKSLRSTFPELEILECIGRGGMGCVYKARQRHLDRLVALKILPAELGHDSTFAERFTREARALAKLNHPNIVTLHDFGFSGGMYYFVMEYMDGMNLRELLQVERPAPEEVLSVISNIANALQSAHEQGIVHRDIKPENILFDRRGHVKIADFGLVKLAAGSPLDTSLTRTREAMGTPHYMAPEQWENPQQVDHRADIYSLGVVLYEMLTGELPLGRFDLPSKKVRVDSRFDDVVLRSMQRDPDRRYQHVGSIETDLRDMKVPSSAMAHLRPAMRAAQQHVPPVVIQARGFVATLLSSVMGFIARRWAAFPFAAVASCVFIAILCNLTWATGLVSYEITDRNTQEKRIDVRSVTTDGFESSTLMWASVRIENYWPAFAAGALALLAMLKPRHRMRSEVLIALLSLYGASHIFLFYSNSMTIDSWRYYGQSSEVVDIHRTINPFIVGVVFCLLFLGALWNMAATVYRSMDENDRGMRSICRSAYRVMMGDPSTYI
ncbi:MAG: serine/threonine protein kinase [Planctomycetes bacterium]|nr:serine/threonine protein kinase [Planctomycetota bacterium]